MQTSDLAVVPMSPHGAEIQGVDLRQELSEALREQIREAWHRHKVLLFRNQTLTKEDQLRALSVFGKVFHQGEAVGGINYVTNVVETRGVDAAGEMNLYSLGEMQYHTDHSFHKVQPSGLMLYGIEIPATGGDTLFSDMHLAYESLPGHLKERIATLTVRHAHRMGAKGTLVDESWPGYADNPMVRKHPRTGETYLFLSRRHLPSILGLSAEESDALADELYTYIANDEIVYHHKWKAKDLVVWDNIGLQHARTNYDPTARRHLRKSQFI